jgi:hypothetical protein
LGNRIGSEIQKTSRNVVQPDRNFTYQEALNSRNPNHKSFIRNLNIKIESILNSIK